MNKKIIKALGKLFAVVVLISAAVFIHNSISVQAYNGETVRVSNAKQLKAVIKNADVGTIILRTDAYINITIKSYKAAKTKSLTIDAPHANIINRAVFSDINIISVNKYTESVSGNRISLFERFIPDGFFISKKKKVESLTLYDSYGEFRNCYTLRKNAGIGKLELICSGDAYPAKSSYDKSKRQLTIECENDDCYYSYIINLDKNGRMISIDCESSELEADYDKTFTYDSNGNIVRISGTTNESAKFTEEISYSGNLEQKSIYKNEYDSTMYTYSYDEAGRLVHWEFTGEDSEGGEILKYGLVYDCEYDEKGRLLYEIWEDPENEDYFDETSYTYNSKGFLIKMCCNNYGNETVYKYKYNKAGSLIEETKISEGFIEINTYEYDELGERVVN